MEVTNYNKIDKVIPKYEELNNTNLAEKFIDLFEEIKLDESRLAFLHMECTKLKQELEEKRKKLTDLAPLFDIKYQVKNVDTVQGECNILISNRDDARNW